MQSADRTGPNSVDAPPPELGGWKLVQLLGRGGMGEVWRGERMSPTGVKQRAAVKRILPSMRRDPVLQARFLAEARTNARLEHPNIVRLLDFGESPEPYLVLEFVEGVTAGDLLRELSAAGMRLPAVAAAFIAAEIAAGLDFAHRKRDEQGNPLGIVHRDVSPHNVLVSLDGAIKLTDFGVVRAADNTIRTQHGLNVGKVVYMAPEQSAGEPVDARADVFSLGVTLWELLVCGPLLPRQDAASAIHALQTCDFPPPSRRVPQLPASLDAIVMKALSRTPANRQQSAGQLAQELRAFIHSVAPGYDAHELTRLLARLLPSVAFRTASSLPPGALGQNFSALPAALPLPPVSPPQALPQPQAPPKPAYAAGPVPGSSGNFSPVNAQVSGRFAPVAPPSAPPAPAAQPYAPAKLQPKAPPVHAPPQVRNAHERVGMMMVLLGIVAFVSIVGGAFVLSRLRKQRRHEEVPATTVIPQPTPLADAMVAPNILAVGVLTPPSPIPPAIPGENPPSVPVPVPPPVPPPPTLSDADAMAVAPLPSVPNQLPSTPPAPSAVQPRRSGSNFTRELARQLAAAAPQVRGCLNLQEGAGQRVRIRVAYNGAAAGFDSVEVRPSSNASSQGCVRAALDAAVSLPGVQGILTMTHTYEF